MWPFSRSLEDVLNQTKRVRVFGVKFKIKKIDPTAYLDGSKAILQVYDTYKSPKGELTVNNDRALERVKEHYRDVFMASVVEPALCRKEEQGKTPVDHLFTEWELANRLYAQIMLYTYGKKKLKSLDLAGQN
jgi:hypothetical protein